MSELKRLTINRLNVDLDNVKSRIMGLQQRAIEKRKAGLDEHADDIEELLKYIWIEHDEIKDELTSILAD